LKDQELALDLELVEAKRNLLQAELEASGSQRAHANRRAYLQVRM